MMEENSQHRIVSSEVYRRMRVFWELRDSEETSQVAYFSRQPLRALAAARTSEEPWFKTVYTQNFVLDALRPQLLYGALNQELAPEWNELFGSKPDHLRGISDEMNEVLSALDQYSAAPEVTLRSAHYARCLAYLGFVDDALRMFAPLGGIESLKPVEAYYHYTRFFIANLRRGLDGFVEEAERAFQALEACEENLRVALSFCILFGVHAAKKHKDLRAAEKWRVRGLDLLERISTNTSFSACEKHVLTSRFYRFASYTHFLRKDRARLAEEALLVEQYARSAPAVTREEGIIKRENHFAMLETRARMEMFFNRPEEALRLVTEATVVADPYDPRLWLQVGDYSELLGESESAKKAFIRGAELGPPFRAIAYFRLGRLYENLGEHGNAAEAYRFSLRANPEGISPLQRLLCLSKDSSDAHLSELLNLKLKERTSALTRLLLRTPQWNRPGEVYASNP